MSTHGNYDVMKVFKEGIGGFNKIKKKVLVDNKCSVILEHYSKCIDWFNSPSRGEGNYDHTYVL